MILSKFKERAGWLITLFAAMLALNSILDGGNSSQILSDTIEANNVWAFYQAKSIKQSIAEGQMEDARDPKRIRELAARIERYESDPVKKEGKRELLARAQAYEAARDEATRHSPWLTFASMAFQLAIVLLSASILAVNNRMYKISEVVAVIGIVLLSQGIWLWF